jgi:hypothetical protein
MSRIRCRNDLITNELDSQLLDFATFLVLFVPLWFMNISL